MTAMLVVLVSSHCHVATLAVVDNRGGDGGVVECSVNTAVSADNTVNDN